MEVAVTTGAISRAKLQSYHHHQKTTSSFFAGQMPFLSPNQQCQSTKGKNITFHGLAYRKLTWGLPTLSLTTNSSWLPWGWLPFHASHQPFDASTPINQNIYFTQFSPQNRQRTDTYINEIQVHNIDIIYKNLFLKSKLKNCYTLRAVNHCIILLHDKAHCLANKL